MTCWLTGQRKQGGTAGSEAALSGGERSAAEERAKEAIEAVSEKRPVSPAQFVKSPLLRCEELTKLSTEPMLSMLADDRIPLRCGPSRWTATLLVLSIDRFSTGLVDVAPSEVSLQDTPASPSRDSSGGGDGVGTNSYLFRFFCMTADSCINELILSPMLTVSSTVPWSPVVVAAAAGGARPRRGAGSVEELDQGVRGMAG
eukprot:CAMPEP_0115450548 /NCGR_PEP_ID=MMETSP0271-20121206/41597_1 /TAXON_ID=71861 /ORGANISM="Scrippsiella trochoidea, Strain CCMP3099" /LENGTH=200 /DNA_ID=CAMNT_0002876771 /DNA_START=929 /DNA_END=1528 /DNA_ORIENTATION=+